MEISDKETIEQTKEGTIGKEVQTDGSDQNNGEIKVVEITPDASEDQSTSFKSTAIESALEFAENELQKTVESNAAPKPQKVSVANVAVKWADEGRNGFKDPPISVRERTPSTATDRTDTTTNTDLSGKWNLLLTDEFKRDYDKYLHDLDQSSLVRSVALSIIGMTAEETLQTQDGKELCIRGSNIRGEWERTLTASTGDDPLVVSIETADQQRVLSECWWEDNGKVHVSWLRGVDKYGGGDFVSKRYLDDDDKILVCKSTFHPNEKGRPKASVTWRFEREEEPLQ